MTELFKILFTIIMVLSTGNLTYNIITYSRRYSKPIFNSRLGLALAVAGIVGLILCNVFWGL